MNVLGESLSLGSATFLLLAIGLALAFEFVNGFHDTANAVATVIYTHSLKPTVAVIWSGLWNFAGVLYSGGAVAFGIVALLPTDVILDIGSGSGYATVFALLTSAIVWNLGTWFIGLPASSSQALIGAILGVGLANSAAHAGHRFGDGVSWTKAQEVGLSLLVSPLVGFVCAALLLLLMKVLVKSKVLYEEPVDGQPPPFWVRVLLILTCTGVSFGHGSNDGQKGMGLIMLILIGILPATYAIDPAASRTEISALVEASKGFAPRLEQVDEAELAAKCREAAAILEAKQSAADLSPEERRKLRADLYLTADGLSMAIKKKKFANSTDAVEAAKLKSQMDRFTKFIPTWVKLAVAVALGLGTMIGWKRIVVTVGEKIGKTHLSYAQGAAAELVTAGTILAADRIGLPVSTTHVLSSGVAGTMAANRSGLQFDTLRNLLLAWVLTLPVTVLLGAAIFGFVFNILLRLGIR